MLKPNPEMPAGRRVSKYQRQRDCETDANDERYRNLNGRSTQRYRGECGNVDCDEQHDRTAQRLYLENVMGGLI
jgi:hypothetical protein